MRDAADAVGEEAGADAADDAEAQHQRQHFGAARHAVAEVAAIGDDVHLRHRHRHAAGDAGQRQHRGQRVGATAAGRRAAPRALTWLRRAAAPISSAQQRPAAASSRRRVNTPIAIWVVRQPIDCMPRLTSGGQIVPPM